MSKEIKYKMGKFIDNHLKMYHLNHANYILEMDTKDKQLSKPIK